MVPRGHWSGEKIERFYEECKLNRTEESNRPEILDANYGKIEVDKVVEEKKYLEPEQKDNLRELINTNTAAF